MSKKERWATRIGLVLAMAGNAVGLGNFLRFPAQASQNGGGAFLIPYLVALLLLGLPLMWVEWSMGRYGGQHGHHSAPGIFQSMGRAGFWKYFGVLGMWSCLIIASYYLYIETWCAAYAVFSLLGGFADTAPSAFFATLTGERPNQILAVSALGVTLFFLCIALNTYILSRGLARGIELVAKVGMPLLILFAALLAIRGLFIDPATDPNAKESAFEGLNYLWTPRLEELDNPRVWLAAAGQIFFTLSIGMGSIHCFASYLRRKDDVALTGATTAWTNEFCEVILGGTILIPIAVAYLGLAAVQEMTSGGSGFGLGFMTFPTLFNNWGWLAPVAGFMWFGLLFFAAITSSLAMGQPIMGFLQQEYGMSRPRAALMFGAAVMLLAAPVAMLHSAAFFDEFDFWAGTFMLVVFAMIEAILFAWVFGMGRGWEEINAGAELRVPRAFYYIIKYVTPAFLLVILTAYIFEPAAGWGPYARQLLGGEPAPAWEWSGGSAIGKLQHLDVEGKIAGQKDGRDRHLPAFGPALAGVCADPGGLGAIPAMALVAAASKQEFTAEGFRERIDFLERLKPVRNINRAVMVTVFLALSALVWYAWKRRREEGRA